MSATARAARRMWMLLVTVPFALAACGGDSSTGPSASDAEPLRDRIVFSSDRGGVTQLYVVAPNGTDLDQLTSDGPRRVFPAVSPDGTRIAHTQNTSDSTFAMFVMNVDGSDVVRLVDSTSEFAWSPDGSQFAYTSSVLGNRDIWVMNADGTDRRNLTDAGTQGPVDQMPTWSPDGLRIAFSSDRSGTDAVWVMNADGSNPLLVWDGVNRAVYLSWSPDGTTIAFTGDGDLYTKPIGPPGTDPQVGDAVNLTGSASFDGLPNWSPDGRRIAFISDRAGYFDVWLMNRDGSQPLNLTNSPDTEEILSATGQSWAR